MNHESSARRRYVFGEFALETRRARVLRAGEEVPMRPKAYDTLAYLVRHPGRLVSKDELIGVLWPKVVVTDDSLVKCIQEIRAVLGAERRAWVKTVPRRGYIFDAPVAVEDDVADGRVADPNDPVAVADDSVAVADGPVAVADDPVAAADGPVAVADDHDAAAVADHAVAAPDDAVAVPDDPIADHRAVREEWAVSGAANASEGGVRIQAARGRVNARLRTVLGRLPARALWPGSLAVLVLAGLALGARFVLPPEDDGAASAGASVKSVAVLPFVSISAEPDQDYFSDGVSEELLNVLSNIPGLHVPSRTSSFAFKGAGADLKTIAAALAVEYVLEGSVRKAGDDVRITAQLVDVATDSPLWSATYDRELTNIFAVQDEIAWSVAAALEVELLAGDLPDSAGLRTPSTEAHDAYLKGLHYSRTLRSEDMLRARASFLRAIELDPGYAAAYAGAATAAVSAQGYGQLDRETASAEADRAVARALELAPESVVVRSASGDVLASRGDWAAADAEYRRAIALNPRYAPAHFGRFEVLGRTGRVQEARAALARALELDPLNGKLNWWMGNTLLQLGEPEQAAVYYRRGIEFEPSQPNNYSGVGDVAIATGRLDEGLRWYLAGLEHDPRQAHMSSIVGLMYLSLGDTERAEEWFAYASSLYRDEILARLFRDFVPLVQRNERPAELLALLADIPASATSALGTRLFRKAVLGTGDVTGIEAFYRLRWPTLFEREPRVDATTFGVATDVAWIASSQGDADRAALLLDRVLEVVGDSTERSIEPIDWASVMVETEALALLGRRRDALAAFRRAADQGWRFDWWQVEKDPTLEPIRSDPEFAAIMAEVEADLAVQLERVRELERSAELAGRPEQASLSR